MPASNGCSHMTCKKCKWEFCWVCMGPWSEHGTSWYQCNRFEEKSGTNARDAQAKSRASLERYLHVSQPTRTVTDISTSTAGPTTSSLPSSMPTFTRAPRRRWRRCRTAVTCLGSRCSLRARPWASSSNRVSCSSGRTAWPSSELFPREFN